MPVALVDALAFVFVESMRAVRPVWADALACVGIGDSRVLAGWGMRANAFALRLVKDLVRGAVCGCVRAFALAGVRVECLVWSAGDMLAHAFARIWV